MTNTTSQQYVQIKQLLIDLENELMSLAVWSETPPSPEAFLSQQPFAYDTMTLVEWIQYIFIPKMSELIEMEGPLPSRCGISPMAEEYFKQSGLDISRLMGLLASIDQELGGLAEN
ncbi:YqcC family protein [Litoribrevibacter albus]|uniref:YqcC-like domain-containing protein n=1 Tax=Litoribrevibacter albus TaxID=1473156 RepID=A0AA37W8Z9_9GAMM|nr:YqcC family protein [Litoribrevibacter albus]GLQ32081.1 hypothetical protein GCM10007876_25600 [Litoribrevibacter albus]